MGEERDPRGLLKPYRDCYISRRGVIPRFPFSDGLDAGWSSPVARQAHNLKVVGSNPPPATNKGRGGSRGTGWRPCLAFEAALEGVSRRELCRKRLAARAGPTLDVR